MYTEQNVSVKIYLTAQNDIHLCVERTDSPTETIAP